MNLENGFIGWSAELMANNTGPAFTEGENWFTVLGVYFPTVTGVMAGISKLNISLFFSSGELWFVFKFNNVYLF